MRSPFRRRPAACDNPSWASSLLTMAALAPSISQAITFNPVPSANLDLSKLGRVGMLGDFNGISLYEYEGQKEYALATNGSESLLAQLPNGAFAPIASTDASIRTMCTFKLKDGKMQGVILGGNFTSLDGTQSTAIALFNPTTAKITPLEGLEGEVNAVLCDQEQETVYVGGNFKGFNSTNAIAWLGTEGWNNLPFAGFNGPVNAITKDSNGHIIFGGSFTGLGNASTPSEPDGQIINLQTATVKSENSASTNGDPKGVICPSNSSGSWLLQDGTPGFWEAEFSFGFEPTKLRLWNTRQDGRGTKTFRFIAYPIDGIMNFTYVDPGTGQNRSCTSECPLSDNADVDFQDFHFVNRVGMSRFRIAISAWYGSGGGLSGVELFQDDIFSYAINNFNEPSCGKISFPSSATTTGPWKESPSLESSSKYLIANIDSKESSNTSVVFFPNIRESGNYSVNMYTPGCVPDNTCSTRGRVNVTGTMALGSADTKFTTTLFQTNNFDKYDQIYFGYIEKSSDAFKPSVTITPLAGQDLDTLTVVAQRVGFSLINSTGGLNGLYDFDPKQATVNTSSFEDSAVNRLGAEFNRRSGVTTLATAGDVTYVGGNFTSKNHDNIVAINAKEDVQDLDGGLNGHVLAMYLDGTELYIGGEFSNAKSKDVKGINNAAIYDTKGNAWKALGAGLNGMVEHIVPLNVNITNDSPETVITFSGQFSNCNAFGDNKEVPVDGFAVWVPSKNNWLQNLNGPLPMLSGLLTAAALDIPGNDSIFAGVLSSAQISANGAATLSESGLGQFPVKIRSQPASNSSSLSRRSLFSQGDSSGVITGLFYDEDDRNVTILAGRFTAESSSGTNINNLVLIDENNDSVAGIGSGISEDSTFVALAIRGSTLFAGGKISGTINDNKVSGLVSYDLQSKSFTRQPPSVSGGNATVSAITVRPDTADVYVGGSFRTAGALDCPGLCRYNVDSNQWNRPGNDLRGQVSSMMWTSKDELLVGGDLQKDSSNEQYLAIWNAKKENWQDFPGSEGIPGPVQVITPGSSDNNQIWITGTSAKDNSVYIMKYDGQKWHTAEQKLSSNTDVRGLQIFTTTEDHDSSDLLGRDQVLMLSGIIEVPNFGLASAALFNGTSFRPFALTTKTGNSPGSMASIFTQKNNFFSSEGKHMPLVFVILIGLAIALGLILLLVLVGIILDRLRKKREGYTPAPTSMYDRGSGISRIPPHELFESLGKGRSGAPHV